MAPDCTVLLTGKTPPSSRLEVTDLANTDVVALDVTLLTKN